MCAYRKYIGGLPFGTLRKDVYWGVSLWYTLEGYIWSSLYSHSFLALVFFIFDDLYPFFSCSYDDTSEQAAEIQQQRLLPGVK